MEHNDYIRFFVFEPSQSEFASICARTLHPISIVSRAKKMDKVDLANVNNAELIK
jgi:hypothetical protein